MSKKRLCLKELFGNDIQLSSAFMADADDVIVKELVGKLLKSLANGVKCAGYDPMEPVKLAFHEGCYPESDPFAGANIAAKVNAASRDDAYGLFFLLTSALIRANDSLRRSVVREEKLLAILKERGIPPHEDEGYV